MVPSIVPSSSMSCYDEWAFGEVYGDHCYAVDIGICTESFSTGCTMLSAQYHYYNEYASNAGSTQETYAYVSISVAYGCEGTHSNDVPKNSCSIKVGGVECNACSHDGATVTMVDCSNIPSGYMEGTFASAPQTISLTEGGGSFEIIGTDEMCSHPSVSTTGDTGSDESTVPSIVPSIIPSIVPSISAPFAPSVAPSADEAAAVTTVIVPSELRFKFKKNKGVDLDEPSLAFLMTQTLDYFHVVLLDHDILGPILLDVTLDEIIVDYAYDDAYDDDIESPGELVVSCHVNIVLENFETGVGVTSRMVVRALARSNWNQYMKDYVYDGSGSTGLDYLHKVTYRGVGSVMVR